MQQQQQQGSETQTKINQEVAVALENLNGRMINAEADIQEIRAAPKLKLEETPEFVSLSGRVKATEMDITTLINARKRAPEEFRGWMLVVIAVVALAPATLCGLASLAWQVVSTLVLQHH